MGAANRITPRRVARFVPGIVEGATRLFPPATNLAKTVRQPGAREKGQPFYNPGMALNRDLSVLLVEAEAARAGREIDVADALAGTGARSLRLAHEVDGRLVVHANDADPRAAAAARRGAKANAIPAKRFRLTREDAHAFLATQRFDVVDLDPCGSPMPFVDAAVRATRAGGLLCATATDTAALAGTFSRVTRRRYDAQHALHAMPWRSEVGLRILAGALVRAAARFDRTAQPILSVSHGHWMRLVVRIDDGKQDADLALKRLGNAVATDSGSGAFFERDVRGAPAWAGPLWTGPLHDAATVHAMRDAASNKVLACPRETPALLQLLEREAEAPAFWVSPDQLQKTLGAPPKRDILIERLRAAGLKAERTHLDPQGIRTDASLAALRAAWGA